MRSKARLPSSPADGSTPDATPRNAARQASIEAGATALGRTWAAQCRSELQREGRAVSGGWPGTMREARIHVGHRLVIEAKGLRNELFITEAEREMAARLAYAIARHEWLQHAEPESA